MKYHTSQKTHVTLALENVENITWWKHLSHIFPFPSSFGVGLKKSATLGWIPVVIYIFKESY